MEYEQQCRVDYYFFMNSQSAYHPTYTSALEPKNYFAVWTQPSGLEKLVEKEEKE